MEDQPVLNDLVGQRLADLPAGVYVVDRTLLLDQVGLVVGTTGAPDDDVRERVDLDPAGNDLPA